MLLENEYKSDLGCLQLEKQSISSQQEEIEELKRKNTELKEIGIVQEKNVKEELEQVYILSNAKILLLENNLFRHLSYLYY